MRTTQMCSCKSKLRLSIIFWYT